MPATIETLEADKARLLESVRRLTEDLEKIGIEANYLLVRMLAARHERSASK